MWAREVGPCVQCQVARILGRSVLGPVLASSFARSLFRVSFSSSTEKGRAQPPRSEREKWYTCTRHTTPLRILRRSRKRGTSEGPEIFIPYGGELVSYLKTESTMRVRHRSTATGINQSAARACCVCSLIAERGMRYSRKSFESIWKCLTFGDLFLRLLAIYSWTSILGRWRTDAGFGVMSRDTGTIVICRVVSM